jgi:hypothetical protein
MREIDTVNVRKIGSLDEPGYIIGELPDHSGEPLFGSFAHRPSIVGSGLSKLAVSSSGSPPGRH